MSSMNLLIKPSHGGGSLGFNNSLAQQSTTMRGSSTNLMMPSGIMNPSTHVAMLIENLPRLQSKMENRGKYSQSALNTPHGDVIPGGGGQSGRRRIASSTMVQEEKPS